MTTRRSLRLSMLLGVSLACGPALAQDAAPASPPSQSAAQCRNAGISYTAGEFACIAACHGKRRLARCDLNAAQATWTYVEESCPTAMINPAWPESWSELPAVLAMSPVPLVVIRSAPAPEMRLQFTTFSRKLAALGD